MRHISIPSSGSSKECGKGPIEAGRPKEPLCLGGTRLRWTEIEILTDSSSSNNDFGRPSCEVDVELAVFDRWESKAWEARFTYKGERKVW